MGFNQVGAPEGLYLVEDKVYSVLPAEEIMFNYKQVFLISAYNRTHQKSNFADVGTVGILISFFRREKVSLLWL